MLALVPVLNLISTSSNPGGSDYGAAPFIDDVWNYFKEQCETEVKDVKFLKIVKSFYWCK